MIAPDFFVPVSVDAMATDLPRVPAGKLARMWRGPNSIRVFERESMVSLPVFNFGLQSMDWRMSERLSLRNHALPDRLGEIQHLDLRTDVDCLQGSGLALVLPALECLGADQGPGVLQTAGWQPP